MKAIVCEMCSSNQIRKEDGYYVCLNCGTQYSVEEARKLLVEIDGEIKIDHSDEITNLYQAARNAYQVSDYPTAIKHYEMLSRLDPDNWEPVFYSSILKTYNIKNGEISSTAERISESIPHVMKMICNIPNIPSRREAVKEVTKQVCRIAQVLVSGSHAFSQSASGGVLGTLGMGVIGMVNSASQTVDDRQRGLIISMIPFSCASSIERLFDVTDAHYNSLCDDCYRLMIAFHEDYKTVTHLELYEKDFLNLILEKLSDLETKKGKVPAYESEGFWKCPICGKFYSKYASTCKCGYIKDTNNADVSRANGQTSNKLEAEGFWYCPNCGTLKSKYATSCKCGYEKNSPNNSSI